jgi:YVTN family beta-propeller protein
MNARLRRGGRVAALLSFVLALTAVTLQPETSHAAGVLRFAGPTSSQTLALTGDGAFLAVANADNLSISLFDVRADRNRKLAELRLQTEPAGVAFLPDGSKLYIANRLSGNVTIIRMNLANGSISQPFKQINVGTEPVGLALTPNGRRLYVANSRSASISVVDTATDTVVKTIFGLPPEPRALAITNDGDGDDADETLYVTHYLALPIAGRADGRDDAKAGHVSVISTATDTLTGDVVLNPIADTGFKALGDALARIPPGDPANPANFKFTTGAYPNQLANIAIKGGFAFVPNTGASPNGPVRFDVNTQSLLAVIDRASASDANRTVNLHQAVAAQSATPRLFVTQPWAVAFKHGSDEGYVASAASNHLVKIGIDPATGAATVKTNPLDPTRVLQIGVGKNPRGIVINPGDTRAYVANHVSRSVSVVDLTALPERVVATLPSAAQPLPGSLDEKIHIGRELYNTSIGEFDPPPGSTVPITGRMSNQGWGSCASCHGPNALSDNVVWIFGSGPRRTIPQHADFADRSAGVLRILNASAERDEEEDFELNIRGVSGGLGLIVLADGVTPDPNVFNLTPLASGGRNQLKVRGVGAWDALKAFIQFGNPTAPLSPVSKTEPDVIAGRALFAAANCQQCHGGAAWSQSRVRFTPPPAPGLVLNGQIFGELRKVGTFDAAAFNEVRANAGAPLGSDGFAPPTLLSIHAFPRSFLHNGAAGSLDDVLNNVTHRSAGTSGVDTLSNAADRSKIVRFLLSIDSATAPIN